MTAANPAVRLVRRAMVERGLDMKALAGLPGAPSYNSVRFFLLGLRETRPQTYAKLERVLDLEPGSLEHLAQDVAQTDDSEPVVIRQGQDALYLPQDALEGLTDAERAEVLHHVVAEAYARSAEVRRRRTGRG